MAEHDPVACELAAAVAAMASFQQVTQQADAKAGTLVTVHVGLAAVIATQIGQARAPLPAGALGVLFWVAGLAYALTFTVAGYLLAQVVRPRKGRQPAPNRFSLDTGDHREAGNGQLATQAWATAHAVAEIAAVKNRYTARAVTWVAAMVLAAMIWLLLAGAVG
ncbi:hypothetical protein [Streptomyces sp. NPDC005322]|uniref:hypothetical protein n=1 Tax=unclassified Streptomyces TaxID=2593676 RepID=UPI0033A13F46